MLTHTIFARLLSLALIGTCLLHPGALTALRADDVGWLSTVQTAPQEIPRQDIGTLAPLLVDRDNKAIATVQDALGLGAAKTDTAYTGLNAAIDVVSEIKAKLVAARLSPMARVRQRIRERRLRTRHCLPRAGPA